MGDVIPVAFRPAKDISAIGEVVHGECIVDIHETFGYVYRNCDFSNSTKEADRLFQEDETRGGCFGWRAEQLRDIFSSEKELMDSLQTEARHYVGIRQLLTLERQAMQQAVVMANRHPRIYRGLLNLRRVVALSCFVADDSSYKFLAISRREGGIKTLALVSARMLFQLPDTYCIRVME